MVEYKEFRIEEVLNWQPQKEIDPLKISDLSVEGGQKYPFYGQATINHGIISYLSLKDEVLNNKSGKPTILIHSNNQNIVYLESPFYLKDGHGATSVLQSDFLNERVAHYLIACIKKVIVKKFSYNEKATKIALKNTKISLPVISSGEIDYKSMEQCICELEEECIRELDVYLNAAGLNSYKLSNEEQSAIERYRKDEVFYKEFRIGDILHIKTTKKKFNANSVKFDGIYPYIARGSSNNGIRGYINQDTKYLNEANTISFGQDTATMFYQEVPYFTGDKIKIVSLKNQKLESEIACYFIAAMKKAFKNFAWGQTSFDEKKLNDVRIALPVTASNEIDFDFIKQLINAQEKLSIKELIDWKDKTIHADKTNKN